MGEPTLSLSMWVGILFSSRELKNSTGYCTASLSLIALSTDLYSFSSQENSFMSQVFKFFTFVFSGERISRSANHSGLVPLIAKLGYTSDLSSSRLAAHFPRSVGIKIVSALQPMECGHHRFLGGAWQSLQLLHHRSSWC